MVRTRRAKTSAGAGKDEGDTPSSSPAKETTTTRTTRKKAQATKGGKKDKKGTKTQAEESSSLVDGSEHEVDEKTKQTVEEEVTKSTIAKEGQVTSAANEWRSSLENADDENVEQQVETEERVAERQMTKKRPLERGTGEEVVDDESSKRTKAAGNEAATSPPLTTTTPANVEESSSPSSSHNKIEVWLRGVPVDATADEVKEALGRSNWVIQFRANEAGDAKLELIGEDSEKALGELLSQPIVMVKGTSVEAYCPGASPPDDNKVENEKVQPASWTVDSSVGGESNLDVVTTTGGVVVGDVSPKKSGDSAAATTKTPQVAVLRLRGLPYSATVDGVKTFFSGVQLAEGSPVHFILNHHGRPSGEAFVEFASEEQAAEATKKDRQRMGERWIEIYSTTQEEMRRREEATSALSAQYQQGGNPNLVGGNKPANVLVGGTLARLGHADSRVDSGVLRMRGIPFQATKLDIVNFFQGYNLDECGVFLVTRDDGRPSGEAYVVFKSPLDAQRALQLDKQQLGDRWVDLFVTSQSALYQRVGPAVMMASRPDTVFKGVVKVRGLPYVAVPQDLLTFFQAYGVADCGVYIINGGDGRPSGEGFVLLTTEEAATRAVVEKNRERIGERWVELYQVTKGELFAAAMKPTPPGLRMWHTQSSSSPVLPSCCRLRGLPFSIKEQDICTFFIGLNVIGIFICREQNGTRPTGEGFVEFSSVDDCVKALSKNREPIGDRYIEVYACTKDEVLQEISPGNRNPNPLPRQHGAGGGYQGYPRGGGGYNQRYPQQQGCTQMASDSNVGYGGGNQHPRGGGRGNYGAGGVGNGGRGGGAYGGGGGGNYGGSGYRHPY